MRYLLIGLFGCASSQPASQPAPAPAATTTTTPAPAEQWQMPQGWRGEVIPFPLDFAPTINHRGFEDLRFPPGFFDPAAGDYWSYAFVWRTDDAAELDAKALGEELTVYFRGLIAAVDSKQRITARDEIVARAEPAGQGRFALKAHVFDAFKTAQPIDLVGWAERRACPNSGALWIFVLAPERTTVRAQLDELARSASCAMVRGKA